MQETVVDNRTSNRQLAVFDVMIDYRNLGVVSGESLNVSLGGMCVDTSPVCIPVDAAVTIKFKIDIDKTIYYCEAHALVMRQDGFQCCMMFDGMNEQTHQALRSLVGDWQVLPNSAGIDYLAAF